MGLGGLFKKIVNPFSMLPGKAGKIATIASGNIGPWLGGPKQKNPLIGALTGYYNPFVSGGGRGGRPPINPNDMNAANMFLGTFSPEDQANIRAGVSNPYQFIDWYRGASAADPNWNKKVLPGSGPMMGNVLPGMGGGAPWAVGNAITSGGMTKPVMPPVEQPYDYRAAEERQKKQREQRAGYAINKPPVT